MAERVPLRAVYGGGVRVLCPHVLGRNKEGHIRILCLQIDGESASGLQRRVGQGMGDWRCLSLEKFSSATLSTASWPAVERSPRLPNCICQVELEIMDQPCLEPLDPQ